MEASEQIEKFREFFDDNYKAEILENIAKGKKFIAVNFLELSKFNPELAEILLDQPEEVIKAAELAIEIEYLENEKGIKVRFENLPESTNIPIRGIRSAHLSKFITLEGIVRARSPVRPKIISAKFECPSCAAIINILQIDTNFREPTKCGCGRKGKFRLVDKELIDGFSLILEEAPEFISGGSELRRINVFLKDDLTSPEIENQIFPGTRMAVNGILKEFYKIVRGEKSTDLDIFLEVNYIKVKKEDYKDIILIEEDKKKLKTLASREDILTVLANSIFGDIKGYEEEKEAMVLQVFGGVRTVYGETVSRGDIHILLIGDTGCAKSDMLKILAGFVPKAKFIVGTGTSGVGATATIIRDELLGGWVLNAGALPLAHKGMCMMDELDKMRPDDTNALHEALEQQTITIDKGNIHSSLLCQTTVLAAANPKWGRFDSYTNLYDQIVLPPALINRFDLIFPIFDIPSEKDKEIALTMFRRHGTKKKKEPELDKETIRKYIAYGKQFEPKIPEKLAEKLAEQYYSIRKYESGEGRKRTIPISPRQVDAIRRIAQAHARVHLSDEVDEKNGNCALHLMQYSLRQIALDFETGKIDIDVIQEGISTRQRNLRSIILSSIKELSEEVSDRIVPIEKVIEKAKKEGINDEQIEEIIEKLKRAGDIYEPKTGFLSTI